MNFYFFAEHKCYFEEQTVHSNLHNIFFPTIKVNVDQQLFG